MNKEYQYSDNDYKYNLSHFDGTSWEHFNFEDSGVPNSFIKAIFCDRDGDLWLGIPRVGLVRYDGTSWDTFSSEDTFDDAPKHIMIDNEG